MSTPATTTSSQLTYPSHQYDAYQHASAPVGSEPPPPYTPSAGAPVSASYAYPPYQSSSVSGQAYTMQPAARAYPSGYYTGSPAYDAPAQSGYYSPHGYGYPYSRPIPTEKTVILVEDSEQARKERERRDECCLFAACWAVLCFCCLAH